MADPRFYQRHGPFALDDIKRRLGDKLQDVTWPNEPHLVLHDVAPLDRAQKTDVSFCEQSKYLEAFKQTKAGLCIIPKKFSEHTPQGCALLITDTPYRTFALIADLFYPEKTHAPFKHPSAAVAQSAQVHETCHISAGVVIEENVVIGPHTYVGPNTTIMQGCDIGAHSWIGSNVSISYAIIGKYVRLGHGCVIGQSGFGFYMDPKGHVTMPQLGTVQIGDYVDIGANTTIDRGSQGDTVIGAGARIDNLVQVAHNVRLGRGCVLVAQVGISGSTHIGDYAALGGQVGVAGHLEIGSKVQIAAQSGVMKSIAPGEVVSGSPAAPIQEWRRQCVILAKLARKKESK